jgi:hypothetical protein
VTTKTSLLQIAQKLQQGTRKHLAKAKAITLGGKDYKPSEITAALQTIIDTSNDSDTKKAAYHEAVEAQNTAAAAAQPVVVGLTSYVHVAYGNSNEILADFGQTPRKKRKPTVKTKAGAQVKAAATREARGTKGRRQREEIVAETPATIPPSSGVATNGAAASAASATPAAKATGAGS